MITALIVLALASPYGNALHHARVEAGAAQAAGAIAVRGRVVWAGGDGGRANERTAFSLASLSKPYVAALTLRLADEGRLTLGDRVARWLGGAVPPAAGAVTIKELLGHTSGLPDYLDDPAIERASEQPRHRWTEAELLAAVRPPENRGRFAYSNTNYVLLGAIARRAGGAGTGALLRDEVLAPLHLADTSLERTARLARRVAGGHRLPDDVWNPLFTDGGVVATAPDVARFFDALLVDRRLLRPTTLAAMLAPGPDGSYGLGIYRDTFGGATAFGHDGYYGGWSTEAASFRRSGVTGVVLLRDADAEDADAVLGALLRAYGLAG